MINVILEAKRPQDVFGSFKADEDRERLAVEYKKLIRSIHPDVNKDPRATKATARLNELYAMIDSTEQHEVLIRTKRHGYRIHEDMGRGDSCNVYLGSDESGERVVVKVARNAADNDLMANEARIIKKILTGTKRLDSASLYLPQYIETFGYRAGNKGRAVQATAFKHVDGLVSLEDVKRAYPKGIPPKHMAWIFRRLLQALGFAHELGVVHGAVLPPHILVHPAQHGLVLIDWKYSGEADSQLKAFSAPWQRFYPQVSLSKVRDLDYGTDAAMAVNVMQWLCGEREVPRQIKAFWNGCRVARVPDAWQLRIEFTELIEELWGPRRFLPFEVAAA